jgi:hypothetical protein
MRLQARRPNRVQTRTGAFESVAADGAKPSADSTAAQRWHDEGKSKPRLIDAQFAYKSVFASSPPGNDSFPVTVPVFTTAHNRLSGIADFRATPGDDDLLQFPSNGTRFAQRAVNRFGGSTSPSSIAGMTKRTTLRQIFDANAR